MGRKRKNAEDYTTEYPDFELSVSYGENHVVCKYCKVRINVDSGRGKARLCEHSRSERHRRLKALKEGKIPLLIVLSL